MKITLLLPPCSGAAVGTAVTVGAVGFTATAVGWLIGVAVGSTSVGGISVGGEVGVAVGSATTWAVSAAAVGVLLGTGVTVQDGNGVGFHRAAGVGVLPFSGGASTMSTMGVYPCTSTMSLDTQPNWPLLNWMSHHSAVSARPTM